MPRILLVNLQGEIAGAERSLLLLAERLRGELGFKQSVACPAESTLWRELTRAGIDCYRLPRPPKHNYLSPLCVFYWLKTNLYLIRAVLKTKADIVHANNCYAVPAMILTSLVTRRKLLLHVRDLNTPGLLTRLFGLLCERVIAVSWMVKRTLEKQGVNPDKIEVVYNGVGLTDFAESYENRSPHENGSFVFANIGQFVPGKNHIGFIKAASHVASELPEARFLLVGDDIFGRDTKYKRSLIRYIEKSSIAEKVTLVGWQRNMNKLWKQINCLVHTAAAEPFGRVIIEAMAHKVPVIATDACGPAEIIENGRDGILVQADDTDGLSKAMVKIAKNRALAGTLADAGCQKVLARFTADKTAGSIAKIYKEVLASRLISPLLKGKTK